LENRKTVGKPRILSIMMMLIKIDPNNLHIVPATFTLCVFDRRQIVQINYIAGN
jgi:hypothetical protein